MRLRGLLVGMVFAPVVVVGQSGTPRLGLVEDLRIGSLDDATRKFAMLREIRPMANGAIAVITNFSPPAWQVQILDSLGRPRWTHRFASGDVPAAMSVLGDTLAIQLGQYGDARIIFMRAGRNEPLTTFSVPPLEPGRGLTLAGSLGGPAVFSTVGSTSLSQPFYEFHAVGRTGVSPEPFLTVVDSSPRITFSPGNMLGRSLTVSQPWVLRLAFATAKDQVFVASANTYDIDVIGMNGTRVRRVSVPVEPQPVTRSVADEWLAEWRATSQGRSLYPDSVFARIRALPVSSPRPVIRSIFASATGELAVVRADKAPSPVRRSDSIHVDILGADGHVRGNVVLPSNVVLHAFTGQHLFAVQADTSRVVGRSTERSAFPIFLQQLVRYRIELPAR